jgi:diguanylate cyclase (GGDEF)-like protein
MGGQAASAAADTGLQARTLMLTDPASFVLATVVVTFVVTGLLVISHAGLGEEAAFFRPWIAGDLALNAGRITMLLQPMALGPTYSGVAWLRGSNLFVVTTTFVILALTLHVFSVARMAGYRARRKVAAITVIASPLAYAGVVSSLPSLQAQFLFISIVICCLAGTQTFLALPVARLSRGAKIIALTNGLIALYYLVQSAMWAFAPVQLPVESRTGPSFAPLGMLIIDFAGSLLPTFGVVLALQERLRQRMILLSNSDPLTGAFNRRGMEPLLERERMRVLRHRRSMAIAMLDLDHFKRVNDQFGHGKGDETLVAFVNRISASKRQIDMLARWGGEEFLLAMPETTIDEALVAVERIRLALAGEALVKGLPIVTMSAGVSAVSSEDQNLSLEELIERADRCLYAAKLKRNCVVAELMPTKVDESLRPAKASAVKCKPNEHSAHADSAL